MYFYLIKGEICTSEPKILACFIPMVVNKHVKCKQTSKCKQTWLKLSYWYHGWSVLAYIALSLNLRVVTFLQPHPLAFYQNRGGESLIVSTADCRFKSITIIRPSNRYVVIQLFSFKIVYVLCKCLAGMYFVFLTNIYCGKSKHHFWVLLLNLFEVKRFHCWNIHPSPLIISHLCVCYSWLHICWKTPRRMQKAFFFSKSTLIWDLRFKPQTLSPLRSQTLQTKTPPSGNTITTREIITPTHWDHCRIRGDDGCWETSSVNRDWISTENRLSLNESQSEFGCGSQKRSGQKRERAERGVGKRNRVTDRPPV